jgi:hypothetical protein
MGWRPLRACDGQARTPVRLGTQSVRILSATSHVGRRMTSPAIFKLRLVQLAFVVLILIGIGYSFASLDTVSGPVCLMMGASSFALVFTIEIAVARVLQAIEQLAKVFVLVQERSSGGR